MVHNSIDVVALKKTRQSAVCDILSYAMLFCMGLCMITQMVAFSYLVIILAMMSTFKYNDSLIPIVFFLFLLPTMFDSGLAIGIDKIVLAIAFIGKILSPSNTAGTKFGFKSLPFVIWFFLACFISGFLSTYDDPWGVLGILISDISIFLMYVNSAVSSSQKQTIIERLAKCAFLMVFFLLAKTVLNPANMNDRLTLEDDLNVNQFAMSISQTSSILFTYMLINNGTKATKLMYLGAFAIGLFLLISTGSRSATIALLGSSLIVYFANMRTKRVSSPTIFYLLVIFSILAVIFSQVVGNNGYIGERYTVDNLVESDGASRGISIAVEIEHTIPENPLFGVGPSGHSEMDAVQKYGAIFSSHNIVFSTLSQIGFFGFIPFVLLCFIIIRKLFQVLKLDPLYSIPLGLVLASILNGVGEVVYNSRMMWFAISFSLYMINSHPVKGRLSRKIHKMKKQMTIN